MVNSLLTAIVRADGDALVMHVGERPYVVAASGPVELSSRPLALEAVTGMLGQLLPYDARRALDELGAIENELPVSAASHGDRFTVVAARGGDDIWIEVRRHRRPQPAPQPVVAAAQPASITAVPEPALAHEPVKPEALALAPVEEPEPTKPEAPAEEPEPLVTHAAQADIAPRETVAEPEPVVPKEPTAVAEPVAEPEPVAVSEPIGAATPEPIVAATPEPIVAMPAPPVAEPAKPAAEPAPAAEVPAAPEPVAIEQTPPALEAAAQIFEPAGPVVAPVAPATRHAAPVATRPVAAPVAAAPGDVMSFEALVDASLKAAVPAPEAIVRPLPAAPIVERPSRQPVESILFDEPVYPAPVKDAAPVFARPMVAAPPEPAPAVVLPLARNAVRMDVQTRTLVSPRVAGIDRLLRLAAARGANTLYLMTQARPSVRADGEIAVLEGEPALTADEVEGLLLDLVPPNSREAFQAGEGAEWMSDVPDVGRVRCQSFRDHRGPGGIFRLVSTRPTNAEQLGLAREIQALCAESEGLILVAGPRASGKSTLVSSLVDLVNRTRNDYVITVESQIKFVHESRGCLVSQREVRGGHEELAAAVRAAVRESPDVLVIDDMRSTEVIRLGLEAMEAGLLVIGGVSAHGAEPALAKVLGRAPMRLALAEGLRGVVSQVLLSKTGGGRVAAREVVLNTPAVAKLIAEGRLNHLPIAIDGGRKHGMVPLNDALAAFVQSGVVDVKEAYRKAFERQAFLAVLKREGIDTSFAERLA